MNILERLKAIEDRLGMNQEPVKSECKHEVDNLDKVLKYHMDGPPKEAKEDTLAETLQQSIMSESLALTPLGQATKYASIAHAHYAKAIEEARKEGYAKAKGEEVMMMLPHHLSKVKEEGRKEATAELRSKFEAAVKDWHKGFRPGDGMDFLKMRLFGGEGNEPGK